MSEFNVGDIWESRKNSEKTITILVTDMYRVGYKYNDRGNTAGMSKKAFMRHFKLQKSKHSLPEELFNI